MYTHVYGRLHVRLIGLGKRFDRAILSNPESFNLSSVNDSPNTTTPPKETPEKKDEAAIKLAQVLPSGIDLDSTMVEHLARAAMELHNKRTGKATNRSNGGVAWTLDEHNKCVEASKQTDKIDDIVKAVGTRSEMEVKAHLRNVSSKEKVSEQLLDDGKKKSGKAKRPPSKAVYTDAYHHFDAKLHLYGI